MRRRRSLVVAVAGLLAACPAAPGEDSTTGSDAATTDAGPTFVPGDAVLLSAGSPTKDEDPSLLAAADGSMLVAWFSDRGGNPDLYVARTEDGITWSKAARVTTDPGGDFYPNLIQDAAGTFHLVWFRWEALFSGHIWHSTSADGLLWDEADEEQVTVEPDMDDWVPAAAALPNGTLAVAFVSERRSSANFTNELYVTARIDGAWSKPAPVPALNSPTEHDHLPFLMWTGGGLCLTWVRHDVSNAIPWTAPLPTSDIWYSESPNGLSWSPPWRLTEGTTGEVNLFPSMHRRHDGTSSLLWLSTRGGSAAPYRLVFDASLFSVEPTPVDALGEGYSHRVAATPTAGVYLGAWVDGPEGEQEIRVRFFDD